MNQQYSIEGPGGAGYIKEGPGEGSHWPVVVAATELVMTSIMSIPAYREVITEQVG